MQKQKGFAPIIILVGVLVIAVVVGGVYFLGKQATPKTSQSLQPTTQPTIQPTTVPPILTPNVNSAPTGAEEAADWKTYTNTKYGFSFQYPSDSDWVFIEHGGPDVWVSAKCNQCLNQTVDYFEVMPIKIKSLDDYINNPVGTSDFTKISLDGVPAVKAAYAGSEQAGGSSIKVFFVYIGQGYEISIWYPILGINSINKFPKANPDILSTFKFINTQ